MPQLFRATVPWLLVAASGLLLLIVLSLLSAYLPATQRIAGLEAELREVYAREAALQTKLAQQEQRQTVREQQIAALAGERAALARRLDELERELAATKTPPRRRR